MTFVLVWLSISVGLSRITAENVDEWIYRKQILGLGSPRGDLITSESLTLREYARRDLDGNFGDTLRRALDEDCRVYHNGKLARLDLEHDRSGRDTDDLFWAALEDTDSVTVVKRTARDLTRDEVVAHIGLRTNVGNEKLGRWFKRISRRALEQAQEAGC